MKYAHAIRVSNALQQIADRGECLGYREAAERVSQECGFHVPESTVATMVTQGVIQGWRKLRAPTTGSDSTATRLDDLDTRYYEHSGILVDLQKQYHELSETLIALGERISALNERVQYLEGSSCKASRPMTTDL